MGRAVAESVARQHPGQIQTVILCGGRGTRLREFTEAIPKVLVEVGGRPILWHIMKGYGASGYSDFILALGYLGERIKGYFIDFNSWRGQDVRIRLGSPESLEMVGHRLDDWTVTFVDTGQDTNTGGRLKRLESYVKGNTFFATYGDGVSNIDYDRLLEFHRNHGRIATVTVTRPHLNFGLVELDGADRVTAFKEKPEVDGWINGGFFVFDRRIFDYLDPNSVLEREPMEQLAKAGELMAYCHQGFWACMDTYKDNLDLNTMWQSGQAPWKKWDE